jgi:TolB protein
MDLKTSQATQITFFPAGEGPVWQPAWSPNGEEIAFERGTVDGPPQRTRRIYVVKADGSEEVPRILTGTSHDSNHPTWSPDGSRIAFSRSKTNSNDYDICTMTPEGKEIKVLTKGGEPAWSPGGKSIAYFSVAKAVKGNENPTDISVIALPNGKPQKLTSTPRDDLEPAWSPDGKRILFVEHRHVNPGLPGQGTDLYAMDADGSNRVRLTFDTTRRFWSPDWQPATALVAPSKVVFQTELANMAMDFPGPQPDWTVTSTIEVEPQRGLLPTEEPKRGR